MQPKQKYINSLKVTKKDVASKMPALIITKKLPQPRKTRGSKYA